MPAGSQGGGFPGSGSPTPPSGPPPGGRAFGGCGGGGRRLGVGSGSTKADFDLLGADYDQRFRTLRSSLEIMRRAWRGEPVNGGTLSPWPGCEGGAPVLLGAWRTPRWINYAAKQCQGWIASGLYSSWEDLENGMRRYRDAGGTNAVLANVVVDLSARAQAGSLAERDTA